ncbi:hypothetical protein [Micromonospora zhanjiangensis]|uniref:SMI1/KNR4 family protein n=1 Tax=Micromonospora zhanjiangensis TaxID=1522057 RepID=A0ABV8KLR4_9ACTN
MTEADPVEVAAALDGTPPTLVRPDSADLDRLPEPWLPIAHGTDPAARLATALALWNPGLLGLLPRFAEALRTRFVDVRTGIIDDCPVLLYAAPGDNGRLACWVGYDPGSFGDPPPFWDSFPEPLREFLRTVHAGFVSGSRLSYGPVRPRHMDTLADLSDWPDGIPDWEADIASTRLLQLCTDGGGILSYCLSPDLDPGQVALVYEGDVDPQDLGPELDQLLMSRLRRP